MATASHDRLAKGFLSGSALSYPIIDCAIDEARPTASLGKTKPFLTQRDPQRFSAVLRLLSLLYPEAVVRFIAAVVVAAFYAVFQAGAFTHVGEESLKIITPAFADAYSPASVTIILLMTFSQASIFHILPYSMSRSSCQSMCSSYGPCHRTVNATAASSIASQNFCYADNLLVSAVTAKEPARPSIATFNEMQSNEMAETDASMVFSHAASLSRWQT